MKYEIKIPAVGESITEATISAWMKKPGDRVERDEVILTLETDKANVDVVAEQAGYLETSAEAGQTLAIGSVVGFISTEAAGAQATTPMNKKSNGATKTINTVSKSTPQPTGATSSSVPIKVPAVGESITEATIASWYKKNGDSVTINEPLLSLETDKATVDVVAEQSGVLEIGVEAGSTIQIGTVVGQIRSSKKVSANIPESAPVAVLSASVGQQAQEVLSPAVRRIVSEQKLDPKQISGTGRGGRITKEDAERFSQSTPLKSPTPVPTATPTTITKTVGELAKDGYSRKVKMTTIRKRIAERLVMAQHTAAILTTFNEINMNAVVALRAKYKDSFKERYGVGLGFMSLFTKACTEALRAYPEVNASIEGDDIVYHDTYNIGVAVNGPKGLIVPVLHNAETLSLANIELKIKEYAEKAKNGKISIEDLSGGTFTISNGGTYGSLLSTPILNPPQSGILGMHKIEDRPIAVNGKVEIHPMMYIALSYDHRLIDGQGAVKFLVKIKETLEDPNRILLEI